MIIEEVLKQRMQDVKNEKGVWVTPAFPKLIYVLDEDNIHEDTQYYYLTELAAKCTAKRMVPDYISAKKMKELKWMMRGIVKSDFKRMAAISSSYLIKRSFQYSDLRKDNMEWLY